MAWNGSSGCVGNVFGLGVTVALILITLVFSGAFTGLLFLAVAAHILSGAFGQLESSLTLLNLIGLTVSIPVSAYIAGLLLDRYCLPRTDTIIFGRLSFVFSCMLILGGHGFIDYFESAFQVVNSTPKEALFFVSLGSQIFFCAGIVAFSLTLMNLLVEAPLCWIFKVSPLKLQLPFANIRILSLIIFGSLLINLIVGLMATELMPTIILKSH